MEFLPFILIFASAFSHAYWNILAKQSFDKESFMWLMVFTSLFTVFPVFCFLLEEWSLPLAAVPFLLVSSIAEALYFISLGRAYELGDLSSVYPLARVSPLFLSVMAVVFLGEEVSFWGALGIFLMVLGVYMIHIRSFSFKDLVEPLKSLNTRSSQFALLSAFSTSVYSMTDKLGVTAINPLLYAFWLDAFILLALTPYLLRRRGLKNIAREWRKSKIQTLAGGFLMRSGYVLVLLAMSLIQVSYVLALRHLSVVIGAASGVVFLREEYGRIRIISTVIMFTGVYVITVLA
jgi:uncharacterized membrane protein